MTDLIANTPSPNTRRTLAEDLRQLGLQAGDTVIVHSSMSKLGWIAGGAEAVVLALLDVLTPTGTLVMPSFSNENSDPAHWQNPPVPEAWWDIIRAETPAYNPATTPTRQMGQIVECFRTLPDARRSNHPQMSFVAWGHHRDFIIADHSLTDDLGQGSPLGRIYDLDGKILLLGVSHSNNTSLHLAEYLSDYPTKTRETQAAAMMVDGRRQWVKYEVLSVDTDDFEQVGAAYEASIGYTIGQVGIGSARLFAQKALVDFAVTWFAEHRR